MSDANSYCQVVESSTGQDQGQASRKDVPAVLQLSRRDPNNGDGQRVAEERTVHGRQLVSAAVQ